MIRSRVTSITTIPVRDAQGRWETTDEEIESFINDKPYWHDTDNRMQSRTRKAQKEYICFITGKPIHKGQKYRRLSVWNLSFNNETYDFTLSLEVPLDTRLKMCLKPHLAKYLKDFVTINI